MKWWYLLGRSIWERIAFLTQIFAMYGIVNAEQYLARCECEWKKACSLRGTINMYKDSPLLFVDYRTFAFVLFDWMQQSTWTLLCTAIVIHYNSVQVYVSVHIFVYDCVLVLCVVSFLLLTHLVLRMCVVRWWGNGKYTLQQCHRQQCFSFSRRKNLFLWPLSHFQFDSGHKNCHARFNHY